MSFLELLLYPPCFFSDVCLIRLIIVICYYFSLLGGKPVLDFTGHLLCFDCSVLKIYHVHFVKGSLEKDMFNSSTF